MMSISRRLVRRPLVGFRDGLDARVNLTMDVWDVAPDGKLTLVRRIHRHNRVTTAGFNLLRNMLNGDAESGVLKFSVGTSATAPAAGDTQLGTEVFRDTPLQKTKDVGKLTVKHYLSSTQANGNTLAEAGLHCTGATASANTGTLYARVTYTGIVKTTSVAVTYTWDLTWAV